MNVITLHAEQTLLLLPIEGNLKDKTDSNSLDAIFEESMIKAGRYSIINSKDIYLLLAAQEILLTDAFNEQIALQIGQLLPAEFMALCRVEAKGSGFFIHAKILDISSGQIIIAETYKASDYDELEKGLRIISFRLCNEKMDITENNQYSSLTVHANINDAVVYIDGRESGKAPIFLENVPHGIYYIEVKKGGYYFNKRIEIIKDTKIYADLKMRFGSLILSAYPEGDYVYIDEVGYGKTNFIERISAEEHSVLILKQGLYWKGNVPVIPEKTVKINVNLLPKATIRIIADKKIKTSIRGENRDEEFSGNMEITEVIPGKYTVISQQEKYIPYKKEIILKPGEVLEIKPELSLLAEENEIRLKLENELLLLQNDIKDPGFPELYINYPVPDLGMIVLGNTLVSFIPLFDFIPVFYTPKLPEDTLSGYRAVTLSQFGCGLFCQLGIAAFFLFEDDTIKTASLITAGIAAGADIILSTIFSQVFSGWTMDNKNKKSVYEKKIKRIKEIEKELAD